MFNLYLRLEAKSKAAPIATPKTSEIASASIAVPTDAPMPAPTATQRPLEGFLGTQGSEVEANDLWVVQQLTAGADNCILTLVKHVSTVRDL